MDYELNPSSTFFNDECCKHTRVTTFIGNLNVREHGIKTFSNDYASLEESVAVLLKIIKSG